MELKVGLEYGDVWEWATMHRTAGSCSRIPACSFLLRVRSTKVSDVAIRGCSGDGGGTWGSVLLGLVIMLGCLPTMAHSLGVSLSNENNKSMVPKFRLFDCMWHIWHPSLWTLADAYLPTNGTSSIAAIAYITPHGVRSSSLPLYICMWGRSQDGNKTKPLMIRLPFTDNDDEVGSAQPACSLSPKAHVRGKW